MSRIRLSLALGAAAAGLALTACSASVDVGTSSSTEPQPTISDPMPSVADAAGYTAEIENNYMTSCVSSASSAAPQLSQSQVENYCGCTWRAFKAEVPFDEFVAFNSNADSSSMPPKVQQFITKCASDPNAF